MHSTGKYLNCTWFGIQINVIPKNGDMNHFSLPSRGATGEMAELSDMMYSMDFENFEEESLGDNSVEEYDYLELEILVDPMVKFGIPPAYDTQSQASVTTLSTAGAFVPQESPQVQNTNGTDTPPGTSEAADYDPGAMITVLTSSVTSPFDGTNPYKPNRITNNTY
jgi:hypothetical protein